MADAKAKPCFFAQLEAARGNPLQLPPCKSFRAERALDADRRFELLCFRGHLVNLANHVHAANHFAERGKALAVGVAFAFKIQLRLVADAD